MTKVNTAVPAGLALAAQSPEFWRRLAPGLTVSDTLPSRVVERSDTQIDRDRMKLTYEGYVHLKEPGIVAPFDDIAEAMKRIVDAGLPSAFIGVYDEVWAIAAQMQGIMDGLFAGHAAMIPNFWASFAEDGDAGTTAGRRRPGVSLNKDGTPRALSVWLPITDATTENGCIYVVPADQDRNYGKGTGERADACLQAIRALPARAGDLLIWTGETYTWQSRSARHNADGPQLALSWEFQDALEAPLADYLVDSFPYVPFEMRLGLIAEQMPQRASEHLKVPAWKAVTQTLLNRYRGVRATA